MSHPATPAPAVRRFITDTYITANVLIALADAQVAGIIKRLVERRPDVIGLVELPPKRDKLLPGTVVRFPRLRALFRRRQPTSGFIWCRPLLGPTGVIGLDAQRYELRRCRSRKLSGRARVRPTARHPRRWYWANRCVEVIAYDRLRGEEVAIDGIHLLSGVQAADGSYNDDETRVPIHQHQVAALELIGAHHRAKGRPWHVLGDTNFDGLELDGATSAWFGRKRRGTHDGSHRAIDDVFGPGRADTVELMETLSDHDAVIVRRRRAVA